MVNVILVATFWVALALVSLAAFRFGGRTEKRIAVLYIAAAVISVGTHQYSGDRYASFALVPFTIDVTLFGALCVFAMRIDRWWIMLSAALQLLTVLGHIAKWEAPGLSQIAYFMAVVSSSFPSLILLSWGIASYRQAQKTVADTSHGYSIQRAGQTRTRLRID